jgi:hypothetical protein
MTFFEVAVLALLVWIGIQANAIRSHLTPAVAQRLPQENRRHDRIGDPWCSCNECYTTNPDGSTVHRSMLPADDPRRRPSAGKERNGPMAQVILDFTTSAQQACDLRGDLHLTVTTEGFNVTRRSKLGKLQVVFEDGNAFVDYFDFPTVISEFRVPLRDLDSGVLNRALTPFGA